MNFAVTDLNFNPAICNPVMNLHAGKHHAFRQAGVRATHGSSSATFLSPHCQTILRRIQNQSVFLSRCAAFAQLTFRESLRDIETFLRAQQSKLYHLGIRSNVARNTLANANAVRDWRIYANFAQSLIAIARPPYGDDSFGVDLKNTAYALDTTTIDLSLSAFPWAPFRPIKAAVKMQSTSENQLFLFE